MISPPRVSIIIPTAGERSRADTLVRAIDSAASQQHAEVEIIVVLNGQRFDPAIRSALEADPRLRAVYLAEGNVSRARRHGLNLATGAYFGFLDDDDELLSGALALRTREMLNRPDIDVLVTNGYLNSGTDAPVVAAHAWPTLGDNTVGSFLKLNWFASPAPLFRRATVAPQHFDIPYIYYEMTYLFFALFTAGLRFGFLEEKTYRVNQGDSASASHSRAYELALPDFLLDLRRLPLDRETENVLKQKYLTALNTSANLRLTDGEVAAAWRLHGQCLAGGGWRYLPFTRHLLLGLFGRRR